MPIVGVDETPLSWANPHICEACGKKMWVDALLPTWNCHCGAKDGKLPPATTNDAFYKIASEFSDLLARAERIAGTHTLGADWCERFEAAHKRFCAMITEGNK